MSLRGTPIDDDGFVNFDDIGTNGGVDGDAALLCLTNSTNCCGPGDPTTTGDWYFPNGESPVGDLTSNTQGQAGRNDYYYRNRGPSVVRLNRNNNPSEKGRFRCDLLGSTMYANICKCSRQHSVC